MARVQVARRDGVQGKVRFRLMTTPKMPRKKVKEGNKIEEINGVERALQLVGSPMLDEKTNEVEIGVLTPTDLPLQQWGLAVVGELLSGDGKQVIATSSWDIASDL
ncbi:MAG: hypothetical protein QF805_20555, partial [Pirellulaceae bacterium]|nr:hypothetical protein [Pirellulaceae bacterium]